MGHGLLVALLFLAALLPPGALGAFTANSPECTTSGLPQVYPQQISESQWKKCLLCGWMYRETTSAGVQSWCDICGAGKKLDVMMASTQIANAQDDFAPPSFDWYGLWCKSCDEGYGSTDADTFNKGGYACSKCPAGTYSNYGTGYQCKPCPSGQFSAAGSSACSSSCPSGTVLEPSTGACKLWAVVNGELVNGAGAKVYTSFTNVQRIAIKTWCIDSMEWTQAAGGIWSGRDMLMQYKCIDPTAGLENNQMYRPVYIPNSGGRMYWKHVTSGTCLTVMTVNGRDIIRFSQCNGGTAQQFKMWERAGYGWVWTSYYYPTYPKCVTVGNDAPYLSFAGASIAANSGSSLQLEDCVGTYDRQVFWLQSGWDLHMGKTPFPFSTVGFKFTSNITSGAQNLAIDMMEWVQDCALSTTNPNDLCNILKPKNALFGWPVNLGNDQKFRVIPSTVVNGATSVILQHTTKEKCVQFAGEPARTFTMAPCADTWLQRFWLLKVTNTNRWAIGYRRGSTNGADGTKECVEQTLTKFVPETTESGPAMFSTLCSFSNTALYTVQAV